MWRARNSTHCILLTCHCEDMDKSHNEVRESLRNTALSWVATCRLKLRSRDSITNKKDRGMTSAACVTILNRDTRWVDHRENRLMCCGHSCFRWGVVSQTMWELGFGILRWGHGGLLDQPETGVGDKQVAGGNSGGALCTWSDAVTVVRVFWFPFHVLREVLEFQTAPRTRKHRERQVSMARQRAKPCGRHDKRDRSGDSSHETSEGNRKWQASKWLRMCERLGGRRRGHLQCVWREASTWVGVT